MISGKLNYPEIPDKSVTWSSSNNNVVTVNNGLVSAIAAGNVTITATNSAGQSAQVSLTVNAMVEPEPNVITVYYDNTVTDWWTTPYIWVWDKAYNDQNYSGNVWPGLPMSFDSATNYFMYSFKYDKDNGDLWLLFDNGDKNDIEQTDDFPLYNNGIYNAYGFTGNYTDGIESVYDSYPRSIDIYTISGVCLKRNATQEDIKSLQPGIYIIGGKKVVITK